MPANLPYNEKELLGRIARGDENAFRPIFDRYWDKIYSIAFTYTKSEQLAEDLVQEVFIKLWNKREQLPAVEKFDSFLFILARNNIISALRKNVLTTSYDVTGSVQASAAGPLPPDQVFDFKESQELILKAVDQLPPQQKRVYELSRVQGLSHKQIAKEMNISIPTIKGHLTKALQFIRSYLDENKHHLPALWMALLATITEK